MAIPKKELEVHTPEWVPILTTLLNILEKEGMFSTEEKRKFRDVVAKIEKMLKERAIGEPKQRQLLATMEKESL